MRCSPSALLLMLLPAVVAAQPTGVLPGAERLAANAANATTAAEAGAAQPTERTPPPPPPPAVGRRRPSMVGYVGDASIGSQLRIRFDSGFENTAPDRAEFFYAKCGCYRGLPPDHPAYDPEAPGPGPGVASELDFRQLYIQAEYAIHGRASVYGELPIRWVLPQAFVAGTGAFGNATGLSDVRGGVKLALVASPDQFLTVQLQADAPSGDAGKGLGTNHWSLSPTVLYFQRLGDRVALESQFGSVLPLDGSAGIPTNGSERFAGRVLTYGVGASVDLAPRSRVSVAPVLELFGWHVIDGFQTATLGPADGIDVVNLKVGARISAGERGSFYVGYGKALTDDTWYDDIVRLEYRFGF
jgi:hypothetical protein